MKSWPQPPVPPLPGQGRPVQVFDTAAQQVVTLDPGPRAGLYVCGITPYDATHLGHAATYVTFDLLGRALRDAGHEVVYVQNVTDIDDPLLERAARDGVDWTELATSEIDLFREDMAALRVIPPQHYVGVVESMALVARDVRDLVARGVAYQVATPDALDAGAQDIYFDLAQDDSFGCVSHWSREQMLEVYADRGGDPDRAGKRDALDPLLWRVARKGEPSWDDEMLGRGRPGWHIECTTIAREHLGMPLTVQGGGSDLIFPHHEMSAVQASGLTGERPFATAYVHQGMVGLHGAKMSKSKGNLELVSRLRRQGEDPMAVRLALLDQHYRTDWEWTPELLDAAKDRAALWRTAFGRSSGASTDALLGELREALSTDLDSPRALLAVDAWAQQEGDDETAPAQAHDAVDALLGIRLA